MIHSLNVLLVQVYTPMYLQTYENYILHRGLGDKDQQVIMEVYTIRERHNPEVAVLK